MSLAIKLSSITDPSSTETTSFFIYLDAVSAYSRDFKGSVTSHPIESGGKVSDHFIRDNPVYHITGVISPSDISIGMLSVKDEYQGEGSNPMNIRGDVDSVKIKGNNNTLLSKIPDSISQYFVDAKSSVVVSTQKRKGYLVGIRTLLEGLFTDDGISIITLYEYKNNLLDNYIENLVMTNLSFKEDPSSGFAFYLDMTLEKIKMVSTTTKTLTKKDLAGISPSTVAPEVKTAAAPKIENGGYSSDFPDYMKYDANKVAEDKAKADAMSKKASVFSTLTGK